MLKIKDVFIQRFYRSNLSNLEQLILLELAFRSDETGEVQGIYYKDIICSVGCSAAQFYNILKSLENKDFITCDKSSYHGDWDILVLQNDFSADEHNDAHKYEKFSNLNMELFERAEFKALRAGARRLLVYVVFRVLKQKYREENNGTEENRKNHLRYTPKINKYKTMAKEIGITPRACREYANELVKAGFISIGNKISMNEKKYDVITLLASALKTPNVEVTSRGKATLQKRNHLHKHLMHYVQTICRRSKITANLINLVDTAMLMLQYRVAAARQHKDIYNIIKNAIKSMSEELSSKTVHCVIRELLKKDYTESILAF